MDLENVASPGHGMLVIIPIPQKGVYFTEGGTVREGESKLSSATSAMALVEFLPNPQVSSAQL